MRAPWRFCPKNVRARSGPASCAKPCSDRIGPMHPSTTILVVDDNEPARYALRRMLQIHGYVVEEAATGAETLRAAEKRPDLIILDIRLPDLNGYEVCRRLKASPRTALIPVLHL